VVVEITPIGIDTLGWQFYIIWTVFNASFVPIVYLFYPETADRTLEDVDRFFTENHSVLVFRDKDAISSKRPARYQEHEEGEMRRNSSVRVAEATQAGEYLEKEKASGNGVGDEKYEKV